MEASEAMSSGTAEKSARGGVIGQQDSQREQPKRNKEVTELHQEINNKSNEIRNLRLKKVSFE